MTPEQFAALARFLKASSGIVITPDKAYLVESRLGPVSARAGYRDPAALVEALPRAPAALRTAVIEAMTTNESSFFRDGTPFERLAGTVLPALKAARAGERRLSFWSAACSNGQEVYSLAMVLEKAGLVAPHWSLDILGTDLNSECVARARAGEYSQFEVQRGLPIQGLIDNFDKVGEAWRAAGRLRRMARFEVFNLLDSYRDLGRFDVILCRNVLIYFDRETKADILTRLAGALRPGGYLFLGGAETALGLSGALAPVPGMHGVYQPAEALARAV